MYNSLAIAQNYTHVDTVVATYPSSFQSVEDFAKRIQKDFTKDADQVRAAYYWMANNITYDYRGARTGRKPYPRIKIKYPTSQEDFEYRYNKVYASHVLNYKTAVCEGYAQLLFFVCEHLNIKAKVISGFAITLVEEIGTMPNNTNHAWNAVFFNDTWNLIDATWSTGNEARTPTKFDFTDSYFCIAPEKLILTHFPEDSKWQLLKEKKSKKEFFNSPVFYEKYLRSKAELDPTMKGILRTKLKDSILLRFKYIDTTQDYYYAFGKDKYSTELTPQKDGDDFIFKIPFNGTKKDYLGIYVDAEAILRFRVLPTR